jgi:hypothetical protein
MAIKGGGIAGRVGEERVECVLARYGLKMTGWDATSGDGETGGFLLEIDGCWSQGG